MKRISLVLGTAVVMLVLVGCGSATQSGNQSSSGQTNSSANTTSQANNSTSNTGSGSTGTSGTNQGSLTVKQGVQQMLAVTGELKTDISARSQAKVQVTAPKLEEVWSSFEDQVKPQFPQIYAAVESSLDPLTAGAKASSPDFSVLGKLNTQLRSALEQLQQKALQ